MSPTVRIGRNIRSVGGNFMAPGLLPVCLSIAESPLHWLQLVALAVPSVFWNSHWARTSSRWMVDSTASTTLKCSMLRYVQNAVSVAGSCIKSQHMKWPILLNQFVVGFSRLRMFPFTHCIPAFLSFIPL